MTACVFGRSPEREKTIEEAAVTFPRNGQAWRTQSHLTM
jgi:hypothetical protein